MQSRPRDIVVVMSVLVALAGVAIVGAVAEVIRYLSLADKLNGFEQSMTQDASQVGIKTEFTQLPTVAIGPTIMVAVVMVAIAAGLIALAAALRQPRPRARVTAFVAAGILGVLAIAQAVISLTSQLTVNQVFAEYQGMQQSLSTQDPSAPSFGFNTADLFPSWPYYVDYLTSTLAVIGCVVVVVLLARPATRNWFAVAPMGPSVSVPPAAADLGNDAPPASVMDDQTIVSDPWMRSIVGELMNGPRSLAALQTGPLGSNTEVLNWRLWDLTNAGVIRQSPSGDYELTPRGEELRTLLSQANQGPGLQ